MALPTNPIAQAIAPLLPPNAVVPTPGMGLTLDEKGFIPPRAIASNELDRTTFSASVAVTATVVATGDVVATSGTISFDGNTTVDVQIHAYAFGKGTGLIGVYLWDNTTNLGQVAFNDIGTVPLHGEVRIKPSLGRHTFRAKAIVDAGTGAVYAGDAVSGNPVQSWIRVLRV